MLKNEPTHQPGAPVISSQSEDATNMSAKFTELSTILKSMSGNESLNTHEVKLFSIPRRKVVEMLLNHLLPGESDSEDDSTIMSLISVTHEFRDGTPEFMPKYRTVFENKLQSYFYQVELPALYYNNYRAIVDIMDEQGVLPTLEYMTDFTIDGESQIRLG